MGRFVSENAERRGAERKMLPFEHRRSDPSRGQRASELAVREECYIPIQRAKASDELISAR